MQYIEKRKQTPRVVEVTNDKGELEQTLVYDPYWELVNPNRRAMRAIGNKLGLNRKQLKRAMKKYPEMKAQVESVLQAAH